MRGAWDRAAAAVLRATEAVISGRAADETAIGAALDAALAAEALAVEPGWRAQTMRLRRELATGDHGAYGLGYEVQRLAPDNVMVRAAAR
jgi:hypothetical protein